MGFAPEALLELKTHVFPFFNMLDEKQIVLYGAGAVGRDYWQQLHKFNVCKSAIWTAKDWQERQREGLGISSTEVLASSMYDYVVTAEVDESAAKRAKQELLSLGVIENKILWRKPLEL